MEIYRNTWVLNHYRYCINLFCEIMIFHNFFALPKGRSHVPNVRLVYAPDLPQIPQYLTNFIGSFTFKAIWWYSVVKIQNIHQNICLGVPVYFRGDAIRQKGAADLTGCRIVNSFIICISMSIYINRNSITSIQIA